MECAVNIDQLPIQGLPEGWPEWLEILIEETVRSQAPLSVVLLGAFSVGKSQLINMLIKGDHLFSAQEEATTLPTFVEFGARLEHLLVDRHGATELVDATAFRQATHIPGDGQAFALLRVPQPWLEGLTIVDLPGLGSCSQVRREYTSAQLRAADAVLYLLPPRGPSKDDLQCLTEIKRLGKRLKILVAQWDVFDDPRMAKEKRPDLDSWADQIYECTGLRARLHPVSQNGLGRDDVLDWLGRARDERAVVRRGRFRAELIPAIENALGQNATAQDASKESSEDERQALSLRLAKQKDALVHAKSVLAEQRVADQKRMDLMADSSAGSTKHDLELVFARLAEIATENQDLQTYQNEGEQNLRSTLDGLGATLCELGANYGTLDIPPTEVTTLNLRLPDMEPIVLEDFLDMGSLAVLAEATATHNERANTLASRLETVSDPEMCSEDRQRFQELILQRNEIVGRPLPVVIRTVEGGMGRQVGRLLGELADIALLCVDPALVGAKAAALLGKGAAMAGKASKAVGVTLKVGKLRKAAAATGGLVHKGLEVSQKLATGGKSMPKDISEKLGKLEMLSLGYWGERLGSALDGPQQVHEIDPEAMAERDHAIARLSVEIADLQRDLDRKTDILHERAQDRRELESIQLELQRLEARIAEKKRQADMEHQAALEEQVSRRRAQVDQLILKCQNRWLKDFDIQARAMTRLLHARVKNHWEAQIETMLAERVEELRSLTNLMTCTEEERLSELRRLQGEAQALRTLLEAVQ